VTIVFDCPKHHVKNISGKEALENYLEKRRRDERSKKQ
jgi:hypothetical protein